MTRLDDQELNPSSEAIANSYSMDTGAGGMKLGHEDYHCSPSSTKVKKKWSHTFTPTVNPNGMYMDKFTFTLRINITYNTTQAIQGYFCSSQ
jgi:hypothetical protein